MNNKGNLGSIEDLLDFYEKMVTEYPENSSENKLGGELKVTVGREDLKWEITVRRIA